MTLFQHISVCYQVHSVRIIPTNHCSPPIGHHGERNVLYLYIKHSVVSGAILFAVVCWGSRLRLNKLLRKAGDVVGVKLDS